MDEVAIGQSWKRQRVLKKESTPGHQEMLNRVDLFDTIEEQVLYSLAYLTAGRISELVKLDYLRKNKYKRESYIAMDGTTKTRVKRNENRTPLIESVEKVPINYPGILKRDILFEQVSGKNIMIVTMANRKNKQFTKKRVPIPINHEYKLVKIIKDYLESLKMDETPLFNFKTPKAEKILAKINMNPHFLRDIRLTHMVTKYQYGSFELVKFAGWKNILPAERYVRLGINDLVRNF